MITDKDIEHITGESVIPGSGRNGIIKTRSGKTFFLKQGPTSRTYQCEANGLKELAKAKAILTAQVISAGDDHILTSYVFHGAKPSDFFDNFGRQFARIHRYYSDLFGFYEDNYIGANTQLNIPSGEEAKSWAAFFFNKRLLFQYKMAERNGYVSSRLRHGFLKLESRIGDLLGGITEPPSLLHGDLWAGNFLCNEQGEPVLIDPAVYYGHREADLAMTKVFGGFSSAFYAAYQEEYPLEDGWQEREPLYKLYHILNHLNIFGTGYLAEAESLLPY